jgi:hypothetical protein
LQALEQTQGPEEKVRSRLEQIVDEDLLARRFGIDLKSTRTAYSDQEWALVPRLAMEIHGGWIESWSRETKKTHKNRFKARRFFLGLTAED